MLNSIFDDDTLLARWLAGTLTPEEQEALMKHPDFPAFQRLVQTADQLQAPEADLSGMWAGLSQKIALLKQKRRYMYWAVPLSAVAAIGLLLLFAWPLFQNKVQGPVFVYTGVGEHKSLRLPDGSTIQLNAMSSIELDTKNWNSERIVKLDGEALFEVTKNPNARFEVRSSHGTVRVLGTIFSVKSRENTFEVQCFEGKVKAETKTQFSITLLAGQGSKAPGGNADWLPIAPLQDSLPPWIKGISKYENAALSTVFNDLEIQYGVQVHANGLENRTFTGSFPHNDLKLALNIICGALDLNYTLENKNVQIGPKDK